MASETTERAVRYNMPGYQGNQVSMVYLYSDQEKTEEFMKSATESSLLRSSRFRRNTCEVCWKMSSFVNIANLQLHKDFCEHWEYKCHHIPVTNETDILI